MYRTLSKPDLEEVLRAYLMPDKCGHNKGLGLCHCNDCLKADHKPHSYIWWDYTNKWLCWRAVIFFPFIYFFANVIHVLCLKLQQCGRSSSWYRPVKCFHRLWADDSVTWPTLSRPSSDYHLTLPPNITLAQQIFGFGATAVLGKLCVFCENCRQLCLH